jgi:hypothetical protein
VRQLSSSSAALVLHNAQVQQCFILVLSKYSKSSCISSCCGDLCALCHCQHALYCCGDKTMFTATVYACHINIDNQQGHVWRGEVIHNNGTTTSYAAEQ